MQKENKIFLAIIIGAIIIGGCIYLGLRGGKSQYFLRPQKILTEGVVALAKPSVKNSSAANLVIDSAAGTVTCDAAMNTIVTKVIDGDTVVVEGGYHVRLLGVDADEKGYPCYDQAKTGLEGLVLGKQVVLEKDKTDLDQYGRCLRYIFLGNTNVDVQLVKEVLAVARFYEPDVKYETEIATAEKASQINGIGCKWSNAAR